MATDPTGPPETGHWPWSTERAWVRRVLRGPIPPDPAALGASSPPDPPGPPERPRPPPRTGRNLPVAIGVGAGLGGLVFLTLLTVKATFLIYVGAAIAIALTELAGAFAKRGIDIPVIPVAAGGAAMLTCMYWLGSPGPRWPRSR